MDSKVTVTTALVLGCAAGFLGGRLAAPSGDAGGSAALEARIDDLEARFAQAASADTSPLLGTAASAAGRAHARAPLKDELAALLAEPTPELDTLLAAAVKRSEQDAAAPDEASAASRAKQIKGGVRKFIAYVDGEIGRWQEKYDLADDQVAALKDLTHTSIARTTKAKIAGASPETLRAIDVETQGKVRQIVGEEVYAATERVRVMREARGGVAKLAGVVGLSPEQYAQVDRVIDEGVNRALPDVIRLRSEPLAPEVRKSLEQRLTEGRVADWARIREHVLTDAQRRRLPEK